MRLLLIFLALVPLNIFSQDFKIGQQKKVSGLTETIPLVVNNEYAIVFFPSRPMSIPYMNGLTSVGEITFRYNDKFLLTKYNLSDLTEKTESFSITKKNYFNTYYSTKEKLYIISSKKSSKDNSLSYFVDVVNFDSFEQEVKNKEIIKFKDGRKRKLFYFKKNDTEFDLIFTSVKLIDNNIIYDYFHVSKDFSVLNYMKIPIKSEISNWKYSASIKNEKLVLFMKNLTSYKTDLFFYSTIGVLNIDTDTFKFSEYKMPKNRFIKDFKILNADNNIEILSLLLDANYRAKELYVFSEDASDHLTIKIPDLFVESLIKSFKFYDNSGLDYRFKLIDKNIFSIESFIKIKDLNRGYTYYKYGPALIFNFDDNSIEWYHIIQSDNDLSLQSNLCFLKSDSNLFVLYKRKKQYLCEQINIENGTFLKINTEKLQDKKFKHARIFNYIYTKDFNFFYLSKNWESSNPFGVNNMYPVYFLK